MKNPAPKIIVAALIVASLIILYFLRFASSIPAVYRVIAAIVMLVIVGLIVKKLLNLTGWYGFYMIGGTKGLKTIDHIAEKHNTFWDVMAMWGLTLGFGLLAYPLMKGKIDKRVFAFGMISLILISVIIVPNLQSTLQFINLPQVQSLANAAPSAPTLLSAVLLGLEYAATIIGGFSGTIIFALFLSTETILWNIVQFATHAGGVTTSTITNKLGVAPVIPGITIPFFAGLIALVVLLTIHEFSHGVLARKAKVQLKSIGVLMFGSVPVGGFVEPDEKKVEKLDNIKQTKIFAAGVSANMIAVVVFFALFFVMGTYVLPIYYHNAIVISQVLPGYPANGILKPGMQILQWNGHTINNSSDIIAARVTDKPNSIVNVVTNTGSYNIRAIQDSTNASIGLIGVSFSSNYVPKTPSPAASAAFFLYTLFALSVLLNFFVGVLNFLPLPGLDGWRIYNVNIKSRKFINFMAALIIILIILNILPIFFYL